MVLLYVCAKLEKPFIATGYLYAHCEQTDDTEREKTVQKKTTRVNCATKQSCRTHFTQAEMKQHICEKETERME